MGSLGEVHEVLAHVAAGRLTPVIDSVLPISGIAEAHRRIEARDVFGKIVLDASEKLSNHVTLDLTGRSSRTHPRADT